MVVLIAVPGQRANIEPSDMSEERRYELREKNRWCMVTRVQNDGDSVTFLAVYEDDTRARRYYPNSYAWLVKKNSIPPMDEMTEVFLAPSEEEATQQSDRQARAYGWEVGRGHALKLMIAASPDNPFLDPNWTDNLDIPAGGVDTVEIPTMSRFRNDLDPKYAGHYAKKLIEEFPTQFKKNLLPRPDMQEEIAKTEVEFPDDTVI
jgi:hypothetical protein